MKSVFSFLQWLKKEENVATVSDNTNYLLFAEEQKKAICETFAFLKIHFLQLYANETQNTPLAIIWPLLHLWLQFTQAFCLSIF